MASQTWLARGPGENSPTAGSRFLQDLRFHPSWVESRCFLSFLCLFFWYSFGDKSTEIELISIFSFLLAIKPLFERQSNTHWSALTLLRKPLSYKGHHHELENVLSHIFIVLRVSNPDILKKRQINTHCCSFLSSLPSLPSSQRTRLCISEF